MTAATTKRNMGGVGKVHRGPVRDLNSSPAIKAVAEFNSIPGTHWAVAAWASIDDRGVVKLTTPRLTGSTGFVPLDGTFLVSLYKEPVNAPGGVDTTPTFRLDRLVADHGGSGFTLTHVETVSLLSKFGAGSTFSSELLDLLWHTSQVLKAPLTAVVSDDVLREAWQLIQGDVVALPVRKSDLVPVLAARAPDGTLVIQQDSAGAAETVVQVSGMPVEDRHIIYNQLIQLEDDGVYAKSSHAAFIGVGVFVGASTPKFAVYEH